MNIGKSSKMKHKIFIHEKIAIIFYAGYGGFIISKLITNIRVSGKNKTHIIKEVLGIASDIKSDIKRLLIL